MKTYQLTEEEQRILEDYENGLYDARPITEAERKRLQQIARSTAKKTRNINIRLTERDLQRLKAKAIEEGIPYQTLAASILHKATSR